MASVGTDDFEPGREAISAWYQALQCVMVCRKPLVLEENQRE
jgi:hypothetical protein